MDRNNFTDFWSRKLSKITEPVIWKQKTPNEKILPDLYKANETDIIDLTKTEPRPQVASIGSDGIRFNRFQIFVKALSGKTTVLWALATDYVTDLKQNIAIHIGYPINQQHLIYGGRSLQDSRSVKDYNIKPISTIILNMRLRGGAATSKQAE